ncbi:MAG: hypothetical protein ABSB75_02035 [Candidatus Limnocylindrales bacterium]
MSQINVRLIQLTTAGAGTGSVSVATSGLVRAIGILKGDLDTPDIAITDGLTGAPVLSVAGVAADTRYQPSVPQQDESGADLDTDPIIYGPPVITGRMDVAISGAGNYHHGQLVLVIER